MKRAILWGVVAVLAVLVPTAAEAARPAGEFAMFLRLNGSPSKLGTIASAGGSTTTNASTATPFVIAIGEVAMVVCDAAAFCVEGATASATATNAAFGRPQALNAAVFWIFAATTAPVFACAGAGAFNCAVFRMQ